MPNMLKPCPFCGNNVADVWQKGWSRGTSFFVKCAVCGAQTRLVNYRGDLNEENEFSNPACDMAVSLWNTRTGDKDA